MFIWKNSQYIRSGWLGDQIVSAYLKANLYYLGLNTRKKKLYFPQWSMIGIMDFARIGVIVFRFFSILKFALTNTWNVIAFALCIHHRSHYCHKTRASQSGKQNSIYVRKLYIANACEPMMWCNMRRWKSFAPSINGRNVRVPAAKMSATAFPESLFFLIICFL
jgi:hypothetical protein